MGDNKRKVPNKAFDIEYATMWGREMRFLDTKGIKPTFIKKTADYFIPVYKYKKTPELFFALAEFFTQIQNEESLNKAKKEMKDAIEITSPEDMEKALESLGLKIILDNGKPKFVKEN